LSQSGDQSGGTLYVLWFGHTKEAKMDNTTLLIIILIVVILLGGGWYGRGRWF
jgi:hypothetical protein